MAFEMLPLVVHGKNVDTLLATGAPVFIPNEGQEVNNRIPVLGSTPDLCLQAADSSADAFTTWRHTSPRERQALFV
jgi:hypothetical protein